MSKNELEEAYLEQIHSKLEKEKNNFLRKHYISLWEKYSQNYEGNQDNLISLRRARKRTKELVDSDYSIPTLSSLNEWRRHECLSKFSDFRNEGKGGGRVGLYHGSLPIQISVTVRLKQVFKLEKIGEMAKKIRKEKGVS